MFSYVLEARVPKFSFIMIVDNVVLLLSVDIDVDDTSCQERVTGEYL